MLSERWWQEPSKLLYEESISLAKIRQNCLTKPAGSLGQLESVAIDFSGWQGTEFPVLDRIQICVFAGDHGVVDAGVSAYPQIVTGEMVKNFCSGGAAIAVIAKDVNAQFSVVNAGVKFPLEDSPSLVNACIANGTENFCEKPAMSHVQTLQAMELGADQVSEETQLFVGGEMGIGNSTAAAAMVSACLNVAVEKSAGRGTGIDDDGLVVKQQAIEGALNLHKNALESPLQILANLGGYEIAALVGAYIRCGQLGIPVLVDGYISSAAALIACELNPSARDWMMFAHQSQEPGHRFVLEYLQAEPLLNLNLRLGEGSGAGVALPIIKLALSLHCSMATFEQASVSESQQ